MQHVADRLEAGLHVAQAGFEASDPIGEQVERDLRIGIKPSDGAVERLVEQPFLGRFGRFGRSVHLSAPSFVGCWPGPGTCTRCPGRLLRGTYRAELVRAVAITAR